MADDDKKLRISDEELISNLSSSDSNIATNALEEIFAAGERMIPLLVSCKGMHNFYWGYKLGSPNSADILYFPDKEGEAQSHVTIEIVALYLLEAIFWDDLGFAESPFLIDRTKKESTQRSLNSDIAISRAWSSVENWLLRLNGNGLDYLRKNRIPPLFESKASFWGSY